MSPNQLTTDDLGDWSLDADALPDTVCNQLDDLVDVFDQGVDDCSGGWDRESALAYCVLRMWQHKVIGPDLIK